MKKLITTTLMLLCATISFAQSSQKFTVKGTAIDTVKSEAAAFATVVLLDAQKQLIASSYCDDRGDFRLTAPQGDYTFQLSMVGYAPLVKTIELSENLDLGTVAISEGLNIGAVKVIGQLVTSDLDKTSYNTEFDPEAPALTALEMMRKVPMLSVDGEETVRLRGETNFKILINGKSSSLLSGNYKDVLRSMPASSIKRIEVITSPPAKYDAEGIGGIINIVTNRKAIEGFNGSLWSKYGTLGDWNLGTYLAGTAGKFNFSGNIYLGNYNRPENIASAQITTHNSVDQYLQNYELNTARDGDYQGIGVEMSYEFDSLNLLTLSINGTLGGGNNTDNAIYNIFSQSGALTDAYSNISKGFNSWGSIGASLDYQRTFSRPDQNLTASYKVDYSPNNSHFSNIIAPISGSLHPSSQNRSENSAWGMEHAFQIDYFDPITDKHQIETGVKYTLRPSISNSINEFLSGTEWVENIALKNDLDYMQHIASAYGAYQFKFGGFAVKAGARAEYTINDGEYIGQVITPMFTRYFNIVPYLNFGYKIDHFQSLKAGYTQRITRPGIGYLNPYVNTENPQFIQTGNPNLDPELTHSFEVAYGIFKPMFNINTTLSAGITNNSIERLTTIVDGIGYSKPENIGQERSFSASLSAGARFFDNKLSLTFNGSTSYKDIATNDGTGASNSGWEANIFAMVSAEMWKDGNVSLNGGWGRYGVSLQGSGSEYYHSNVSVTQRLFEKRLGITLSVASPLTKYNFYEMAYSDPGIFDQMMKIKTLAQDFSLSLSWRFGSVKGFVKQTKRTIESNDQLQGGGGGQGGAGGGAGGGIM